MGNLYAVGSMEVREFFLGMHKLLWPGLALAPPYFPLDTTFSLLTHNICTRNRAIRGLMHGDLVHQHALTQFCTLFLKYSGNLNMANKGRNM